MSCTRVVHPQSFLDLLWLSQFVLQCLFESRLSYFTCYGMVCRVEVGFQWGQRLLIQSGRADVTSAQALWLRLSQHVSYAFMAFEISVPMRPTLMLLIQVGVLGLVKFSISWLVLAGLHQVRKMRGK